MKKIALTRKLKVFSLMPKAFLFLLLGLLSCDTGNGSNAGDNSQAVISSRRLEDNKGRFLGYLIGGSSKDLTVYTTRGYFVRMDWEGNISKSTIYYTDVDAGGTAFTYGGSSSSRLKAVIQGNDKYYFYTKDEYRDPTENPITYSSSIDYNGLFKNKPQPSDYFDSSYTLLKEIEYKEIGLPSEIKLPLKILWD